MEKAPVVRGEIVNIEDQAMSIESLLGQVKLIQDVMEKVMKKDEHYGIIPGTKKPSLYKPGAEKLCLTFRLNPDYEILREIREKDFIAYTVKCNLTHISTGQSIASGIGSCNSRETKYRYRFIEESTGVPVPKKYWDAKKNGDSKEMKRFLQVPNYDPKTLRAAKIDGEWVIAKSEKVENDNPWDLDNTLIKMSCKRSLTGAILNATAASDIFTQDTEDLPKDIIGNEKDQNPSKEARSQKKATQPPPKEKKVFVETMADLEKEFESVDQLDAFQEALRVHQAEWDDTLSTYTYQSISDRDMQEKVYSSLKKYLKTVKDKDKENSKT